MTSNGSSHVGPIKERRLSFHRIRHPDGPYTSLTRKHIGLSTSQLLLGHRHFNHRSSPPQARAQDKTIDFRLSHSQRPIAEARLPRLELKTGSPTSAHPTSIHTPPSSSFPPPASIPIPITAPQRVHPSPQSSSQSFDCDRAMDPRAMQKNPLTLAALRSGEPKRGPLARGSSKRQSGHRPTMDWSCSGPR